MRTKLRHITVDNQPYLWTTYRPNGDGDGGIGLRIWRDKKVIIERWISSMDDPWPITPLVVANEIRSKTFVHVG